MFKFSYTLKELRHPGVGVTFVLTEAEARFEPQTDVCGSSVVHPCDENQTATGPLSKSVRNSVEVEAKLKGLFI